MTDKEQIEVGNTLRYMQNTPGWKLFKEHIQQEAKESLERFIDLPAHKLTDFEAFQYKAEYRVRKNDLSWVEEQIRAGEQANEFLKREEKLATTR